MKGPIYVQIDQEHEVLELVDNLKQDLIHAKKLLHELYAIRSNENKSIREIKERIKQMQYRITRIDEEILE